MADLDLDDDLDAGGAPEGDDAGSGSGGGGWDMGVVFGLVGAFGALIVGLYLEGSTIDKYILLSPFVIVIGGTLGATLTGVGLPRFKQAGNDMVHALRYQSIDRATSITTLVGFAEKARREGLLVLEDDLQKTDDDFMRRGVQLVVDGTDPELVKEILRTEVDSLHEERHQAVKMWEAMGGYSPTLGVLGTVIGLVLVLSNISSPEALAAAIAVAFVATLYGVMFANVLFLPIAQRLSMCASDEVAGRELVIEGILAIQSGDNPRIVEEKLVAFLDTRQRLDFLAAKSGPGGDGDLDLDLAA